MMYVRYLDVAIVALEKLPVGEAIVVQGQVDHAFEGRFQRREPLHGGSGARILLFVEGERAVVMPHRHEAAVECAYRDRCGGTLLALIREEIELLAADLLDRSDQVG